MRSSHLLHKYRNKKTVIEIEEDIEGIKYSLKGSTINSNEELTKNILNYM